MSYGYKKGGRYGSYGGGRYPPYRGGGGGYGRPPFKQRPRPQYRSSGSIYERRSPPDFNYQNRSRGLPDDNVEYFELGNRKRLAVKSFNGNVYVDVREYFEKGGELVPTKRGCTLQIDMWKKLLSVSSIIDNSIQQMTQELGDATVTIKGSGNGSDPQEEHMVEDLEEEDFVHSLMKARK